MPVLKRDLPGDFAGAEFDPLAGGQRYIFMRLARAGMKVVNGTWKLKMSPMVPRFGRKHHSSEIPMMSYQ